MCLCKVRLHPLFVCVWGGGWGGGVGVEQLKTVYWFIGE